MSAAVLVLVFAMIDNKGGVSAVQIDMPSMEICRRELDAIKAKAELWPPWAYCFSRENN